MKDSRFDAVIAHCWPWWRAEFEIGFRAFQAANIYHDTGWLAAQAWKEWNGSGVYGPMGTDLGMMAAGDASQSAAEELAHYHGLITLCEAMEAPLPDYHPGPAAMGLTRFRNGLWEDPLLRHGVRMSEGGGLGLLHGAVAGIGAVAEVRPQDDPVRDCFQTIIADEVGHLGGAIREYLAIDFAVVEETRIFDALGECLALKVAERQEQFSAQLSLAHPPPDVDYRAALASYRGRITMQLAAFA